MRLPRILLLLALAGATAGAQASKPYVPPPDPAWETRAPEQVGMSAAALAEAFKFADTHATPWPTDLRKMLADTVESQPEGEITGPTKPRGTVNGLVIRHGYIVWEHGDTRRVDMTFSATKSYLSTTVGLAVDRGLIRSVQDPMREYIKDGAFDSPHNSTITWHQMLQQTNEWEGTLFGKTDKADRRLGRDRVLQQPGTLYEYNDVRVNRTSLSSLQVWKRPLPEVLKELVMDPIGASNTWEWHGYSNSDVVIDGRTMKSVGGGGHWGGGLWINTRDHARFGLLFLRKGQWGDRRIISEQWVRMALTPGAVNPVYGYMWWLNTNQKLWPSAPADSFAALGGNLNAVWVSPQHDLVVVIRWIDNQQIDGFLGRVLAAIKK
jgi:CubicO group peptidase (beta-lactamase class C family)